MSDKSNIEWTDATWSPVTGCDPISPGCKHCYAKREVEQRWSKNPKSVWFGRVFNDVQCHAAVIEQPLRWAKPRKIFVCPRADLFHPDVPDSFIDRVFVVMAIADRHVFQVLTKRSARMLAYLSATGLLARLKAAATALHGDIDDEALFATWPLPNVWLGVSVEDQAAADERIPLLLKTPAAVRWISAEPLLGPIDITPAYLPCPNAENVIMDPETGAHECCSRCDYTGLSDEIGVDWVVAGGESGHKARPMHPDWARSLRDQCAAAGTPYLFKQWGEWAPGEVAGPNERPIRAATWWNGGWDFQTVGPAQPDAHIDDEPDVFRVGKRAAGRLLDGVLHDGYPEVRS